MKHLFTPVALGPMQLKHRVVMAPLTRSRSEQPDSIPGDLMVEYYGQRTSDGGLIVGEATSVSAAGRGWYGAPGLFTDRQVEGWKRVTHAVHARGGKMFAQLWHTGRSSHIDVSGVIPVSASVNEAYWQDPSHLVSTPGGWAQPSPHRALDVSEIPGVVESYRQAAERAKAAGFDGVELHAANGYLVAQFLEDNSNKRTDAYGGSIERRARFLFEVVEAMVSVWGGNRVAVRIAPGGKWNDMADSNPIALYQYVVAKLNAFGLAYLHVVEPRVKGNVTTEKAQGPVASEQLRKIFHGRMIAAGGFEPDTAEQTVAEGIADAIAFGRHFVANPDLPRRIRDGIPLTRHDRDTFYTFDAHGYTDYPFAEGSAKS